MSDGKELLPCIHATECAREIFHSPTILGSAWAIEARVKQAIADATKQKDARVLKLEIALREARERLSKHHDIAFIHKASDKGFGRCEVCAESNIFLIIDDALNQEPQQ